MSDKTKRKDAQTIQVVLMAYKAVIVSDSKRRKSKQALEYKDKDHLTAKANAWKF